MSPTTGWQTIGPASLLHDGLVGPIPNAAPRPAGRTGGDGCPLTFVGNGLANTCTSRPVLERNGYHPVDLPSGGYGGNPTGIRIEVPSPDGRWLSLRPAA